MRTFPVLTLAIFLTTLGLLGTVAVAPPAAATSCTPDMPCPPPSCDYGCVKRVVTETTYCVKHFIECTTV